MDKWIENGGQSAVLTYKQRRQSMEGEKSEKLGEREEQLIVLDEGIDMDDMADPRGFCCRGALFPFR
jgi:hypothetical protein